MKRFSFPLERVLQFRRQQEELEWAKLEGLVAERTRLEQLAQRMHEESRLVRAGCASGTAIAGAEIRQVHYFAESLWRAERRTLRQVGGVEAQRREQVEAVLEARRKVRLLELLRAKRRAQHTRLAGRELEAVAAELHLAKLARRQEKIL